jgi:hypothetical protein
VAFIGSSDQFGTTQGEMKKKSAMEYEAFYMYEAKYSE